MVRGTQLNRIFMLGRMARGGQECHVSVLRSRKYGRAGYDSDSWANHCCSNREWSYL
jgi:hypothetical protein